MVTMVTMVMVTILIMLAKMATPGTLKIKEKKCYGIIISLHDVTNKNVSHDSNYNKNDAM